MQQHHLEGAPDTFSRLIRFQTSPLLECLVSLQAAVHPWQHQDWGLKVKEQLGEDYINEVSELYNGFHLGCDFTELFIDYDDHGDIIGFFEYVENLTDRDFLFYTLGRVYPREMIPDTISASTFDDLIKSPSDLPTPQNIESYRTWTEDLETLRSKLLRFWRVYWNDLFASEVDACRPYWTESLREKEELLGLKGGMALYENVTGYKDLPEQLPADQPYTDIAIIPIYRSTRRRSVFYGYGNITILYDCRLTRAQEEKNAREMQNTIQLLKALADENRMKILKLIADAEHSYNGKGISEKIGLSPSVVSRHLSQLRDAGLISEHSCDNRNITYSFKREAVTDLPQAIFRYLHG